jgi:hypothetical protein
MINQLPKLSFNTARMHVALTAMAKKVFNMRRTIFRPSP